MVSSMNASLPKCTNNVIHDRIMSGLMMGDMTMNFNGKIVVTCPQSNLKIEAVLNYNVIMYYHY